MVDSGAAGGIIDQESGSCRRLNEGLSTFLESVVSTLRSSKISEGDGEDSRQDDSGSPINGRLSKSSQGPTHLSRFEQVTIFLIY